MSLLEDIPIRSSQPGAWTLRINQVPPSGNVVKRMHWTVYTQLLRDWFYLIRSAEGFATISRPKGKRYLEIIRYGKRALDRQNLWFSMKPVVDVLRPAKEESGIYKSGKRKGEPWHRSRIGHGLILEDDEKHLEDHVSNGILNPGESPYLVIRISDFPMR